MEVGLDLDERADLYSGDGMDRALSATPKPAGLIKTPGASGIEADVESGWKIADREKAHTVQATSACKVDHAPGGSGSGSGERSQI